MPELNPQQKNYESFLGNHPKTNSNFLGLRHPPVTSGVFGLLLLNPTNIKAISKALYSATINCKTHERIALLHQPVIQLVIDVFHCLQLVYRLSYTILSISICHYYNYRSLTLG